MFQLSLKTQKLARFRNNEHDGVCQQDQQVDQRKEYMKLHLFLLFSSIQKRETADWQSRERMGPLRADDRERQNQLRKAHRVDDHLPCTGITRAAATPWEYDYSTTLKTLSQRYMRPSNKKYTLHCRADCRTPMICRFPGCVI